MKNPEYEKAIEREVAEWPGVTVEFAQGAKHPKAKLTFNGKMLAVGYSGTPSDTAFGIHQMLGDMRRAMKKLGASRPKPEPTKEEDEAPYRKKVEQPAKMDKVARHEEPKPRPADKIADGLRDAIGFAQGDESKGRVAVQAEGSAKSYATRAEAEDIVDELRAAFEARVAGIVDGIYFNLPADVYHAVPRLSSSGIQKLCVSPATFWRGSWLDPDRPDPDEDETVWQVIGRAYHVARLEPHLFEQLYVRELDKKEAPKGTLFTATEMGAKLEDLGLKKSGSVLEQAERLEQAGFPSEQLWHCIQRDWEAARGSRVKLPAKHYDQMVTDRDRITANSQIAPYLSGGEAEVSVFWTDKHGIKMKARIDYLTRTHWADFKTFDNSRGKHLKQALTDAVRYNRYYIQAPVYREAVEQIRVGGLPVIEADTEDQRSLIAALQFTQHELDCWYIFQEKGGIPNLLARKFPFYKIPYSTILNEAAAHNEEEKQVAREATRTRSDLFRKGEGEVLEAKKLFVLYSEVYKDGTPWFPIYAVDEFNDMDFHPYWLSGELA